MKIIPESHEEEGKIMLVTKVNAFENVPFWSIVSEMDTRTLTTIPQTSSFRASPATPRNDWVPN